MTVGFVALWKNNPVEYHASQRDEWDTTARIQDAFARGRGRGNRTYGLYQCRWSSAYQYLTFWVAPSLTAVTDTIADLERAGDFKFADSEHIIGRFQNTGKYLTPAAWDEIPEAQDEDTRAGMFLAWREISCSRDQARDAARLPAVAASYGIQMLGEYDCRFSTAWERFTFWIAPNVAALEEALEILERDGTFVGTETRAVVGRLERHYRFGNHLQTDLPWLREEGAGM